MPNSLARQLSHTRFKALTSNGKKMEVAAFNGRLFTSDGRAYVRELGGFQNGENTVRNVPSPIRLELGRGIYIAEGRIVLVKKDYQGRDYIYSNDSDDLRQADINPRQLNPNDPSTRFRTMSLLSDLQSFPTGGDGTVMIHPGLYRKSDGSYQNFAGQLSIDLLTAYKPVVVDNQHIVALWINEDTNTSAITTSSEISQSIILKDDIPTAIGLINEAEETAPENRVGVWSYIVRGDDTVISEKNKFIGLRGIINVPNSGSGASTSQYIDQSGGTADTYGVLSGAINGANTTFTVSQAVYNTGSLSVYLNGQLQTQGTAEDWTETLPSAGTLAFATAPLTGDLITVNYTLGTVTGVVGNIDISKTANYTITGSEADGEISIDVDASTGNKTITLPTAASFQNRFLNVSKTDSSTNIVIIDGDESETINDDLTITMTLQYTNLRLQSDGVQWRIR